MQKREEKLKEIDQKICEIENLLNQVKPKDSHRVKGEIFQSIMELNGWQQKMHAIFKDPAMKEEKKETEKKIGFQVAHGTNIIQTQ